MSKSILSQVLDAFENSRGPVTLAQIARDLRISPARLEGMIQYWVRKGNLRETSSYSDCGACGCGANGCPYVLELPRSYEVAGDETITLPMSAVGLTCSHKQ